MRRPIRVFLSYRRVDAEEAAELQRQFALRGLALWRDVNDLPLGGFTIPEIKRGIRRDSDAFALYVTPRVFSSHVIWTTEVPEALARAARANEPLYPIVPIMRGVSLSQLTRAARARSVAELGAANAEFVARDRRATVARRRAAFARVARRLLRALLRDRDAARTGLCLRSFHAPEVPPGELDLDWSDIVDGASPAQWSDELLPALLELRTELARVGRRDLEVFVKVRLAAALAFGLRFGLTSGFRVRIRDRSGLWPSHPGASVLLQPSEQTSGRRARVVLEVSLTQTAERSARELAERLRARYVRLLPPSGQPTRGYDPRPDAGRIGGQIGELVRDLRADGMDDLHLVFVGPAALALLIARHLHAIGRVHSYYRTPRGLIRAFSYAT